MPCYCDLSQEDCFKAGHAGPLAQLGVMLKEAEAKGLKNIRFEWAEGAEHLSSDQRAAAVIEWMNATKAWDALTDEKKMREQIKQVYEKLGNVIDLTKTDLREEVSPEDRTRRSKLFGAIEQSMLLLGNWVDHGDKMKMRAARPTIKELLDV